MIGGASPGGAGSGMAAATSAAARRPIAITMGDPCGIGPEIVLKAFSGGLPAPALVVGDPGLLAREAARLKLPLAIETIASPASLSAGPAPAPFGPAVAPFGAGADAKSLAAAMRAAQDPGLRVPVIATTALPADLPAGRVDARAGDAAYRCIARAAALALRGEVRAVVTAPISKEAMHLAGHDYPGHTELLAELAGGVPVRMMLANSELRTVLVTIHVALREAIASLTVESVLQTIEITDAALRAAGIDAPRVAVAGVNPHAGEAGMFGREEIDVVAPAIARARERGIDASGPHPPDTVFMRARGFARYDVVVAMYHDQGLIPVKYLGIDDGVNVTIGLPFVRTSPDHGTAFDIAGTPGPDGFGAADERSLVAAFRQADAMSARAPR
jgi:4-hydroxythreonine-4-phosphate dehydrogenase